jgi:hypothetical protein
MDSTGPSTAPMALKTNVAPSVAKPLPSTPSRPPSGSNDGNVGNWNKNNNRNRNSGNGGGNNGKNSNNGSSHGGSFGQTTAPTGSDIRPGAPWTTYGHPWYGHMTVHPGPVPTGQQHPQAFMATPGLYTTPGFHPDSCSGSSSSRRYTSMPPLLPH